MNNATSRMDEICELLLASVPDVYLTMLSIEALPVPEFASDSGNMVAASVGLVGDANGVIYIHVTSEFATLLASRMLDMPQEELDGEELINDTIGELTNMVVGSVKSRLCDNGITCALTIPSVVRGHDFRVAATGCPERRLLHFRCADNNLVVEVQMKAE